MLTENRTQIDEVAKCVFETMLGTQLEVIDKTAAVVTELVAQRTTMQKEMMDMQPKMMEHMMAHMQGGMKGMPKLPKMPQQGGFAPAAGKKRKKGGPWGLIKTR